MGLKRKLSYHPFYIKIDLDVWEKFEKKMLDIKEQELGARRLAPGDIKRFVQEALVMWIKFKKENLNDNIHPKR